MSTAASNPSQPAATASGKVAKKKTGTAAAPAAHPKYSEMVQQALVALKERGGSSRQAVLKYIMANFKVAGDENMINAHVKMALKAGVKNGALKQSKGTGATGSFRIGEKAKKAPAAAVKKAKAPVAAKPKKSATAAAAAGKGAKKPIAKKAAGESKIKPASEKMSTKATPSKSAVAKKTIKKTTTAAAADKKKTVSKKVAAAGPAKAKKVPSAGKTKAAPSNTKKSPVKKATTKKAVVAKLPKVKA